VIKLQMILCVSFTFAYTDVLLKMYNSTEYPSFETIYKNCKKTHTILGTWNVCNHKYIVASFLILYFVIDPFPNKCVDVGKYSVTRVIRVQWD